MGTPLECISIMVDSPSSMPDSASNKVAVTTRRRRWLPWTVGLLSLVGTGWLCVHFLLAHLLLMFAMSGECRAISDRGPSMTSILLYSCVSAGLQRLNGPLTRENLEDFLADITAAAGPDACGRPYRYAVSNQLDWGLIYSRGLADDYPRIDFTHTGWCGYSAVVIDFYDYWPVLDLQEIDRGLLQLAIDQ